MDQLERLGRWGIKDIVEILDEDGIILGTNGDRLCGLTLINEGGTGEWEGLRSLESWRESAFHGWMNS